FEGRAEPAITDPYRAYALDLAHKHLAEMQRHAGLAAAPLFSPAVGAFRQGMLVQIPLLLWSLPGQLTGAVLRDCLSAHYAGQPYIRVVPSQEHPAVLAPEGLNGTNNLELFVFANDQARTALLVARLDNLGKGASGAAVQNMELMLGLTQKK
ncbi:MAG TPA: N-acetyl-gamma-glutamyl-phosphate reductase, partial [Rhodospirillaceae bacterium]|nr:N-acetyl-gamma-glutamyl-phosphate reductase [Rhodospirillaceae bacterium]